MSAIHELHRYVAVKYKNFVGFLKQEGYCNDRLTALQSLPAAVLFITLGELLKPHQRAIEDRCIDAVADSDADFLQFVKVVQSWEADGKTEVVDKAWRYMTMFADLCCDK